LVQHSRTIVQVVTGTRLVQHSWTMRQQVYGTFLVTVHGTCLQTVYGTLQCLTSCTIRVQQTVFFTVFGHQTLRQIVVPGHCTFSVRQQPGL
jgi:hypothetical protein